MTQQTRVTNASRFETGDIPQGSDFSDLIDSYVSLADTAAQTVASDLRAANLITAGKVSAAIVNAPNIIGHVSAAVLTGNQVGLTNVSATNITGGAISITGTMSANSMYIGSILALASAGGTSGRVLTTANNPVIMASANQGQVVCRGFVKITVEGTVVCIPYWYSTA